MDGIGPTAGALLDAGAARLAAAGIGPARHEASLLLAEASGLSRSVLLADRRRPLETGAAERYERLVARRARRVPLQHLLGRWPFLDFDLRVDHRALVPRGETEQLALWAIETARRRGARRVVDVGTGSGCVAIALARAVPEARVVAVDVSAAALELAWENIREQGLSARARPVRATLATVFAPGSVELIVANLPYVAAGELAALEPEVREHEPREALVAGEEGLALIRELVTGAPAVLASGGDLLLECDPRQVDSVRGQLARGPWHHVALREDLSGRPRMLRARFEGPPARGEANR